MIISYAFYCYCSLPDRQLRKIKALVLVYINRSLPDRQLRNSPNRIKASVNCSLPDRQLRNLTNLPIGNPASSLPDRQLRNLFSVHDKFHRTLILSGFCLLKIARISLNSSFFPKPLKR